MTNLIEQAAKRLEELNGPGSLQMFSAIPISHFYGIEIADFAQREKVDLTVVGPELSLSLGIADEFKKRNLRLFGPTQIAATIERDPLQ